MMKAQMIQFTLSLFLVPIFLSAQVKQYTLKECVELALEKNISIKQNKLDYANAELDKQAAIANFFPNLNANANHSWNIGLNQNITTGLLENITTQFSSGGLNLGVNVYNGLQNVNQLHRANLAILSRQYQLADISDDISLLVANGYLQIMFNREILGVQKAQLQVSQEELARTEKLIKAQVLPRGDRFEIEANIASQEQAIILAENSLHLAKISLAQLLLITDYENFDISFEELEVPFSQVAEETPKSIFKQALEIRNDIKLATTNLEIAETDVKLAKGVLQPSLVAFYGYSTRLSYSDRLQGTGNFVDTPIGFVESTGQRVTSSFEEREIVGPLSIGRQLGLNDGHNFGLQLNIPIFNAFRSKNNLRKSKINVERTKNLLEQEKLTLEADINQSYSDTKGAYSFYQAAIKTTMARDDAFQNAQVRYKAGVMNVFEYSQIKQRYETAVSDQVRAKYDYIFKLKVLEFYFGYRLDI